MQGPHKKVAEIAGKMGTLAPDGVSLTNLDSLTLIDFVLELERAFKVSIPSSFVLPGRFESVASVVEMLADLK